MNNRAEMLKTHSTAQLTSHLQLFPQESSVPRSNVAIVTTKDILSERSLKKEKKTKKLLIAGFHQSPETTKSNFGEFVG